MSKMRIFVRHYCANCGSQVTPSSKFERMTLAPDTEILLTSFNNRDVDGRVGWCFGCKRRTGEGWQALDRLTETEILQKYIARRGVHIRLRNHRKSA
jgi:hypothetical protein